MVTLLQAGEITAFLVISRNTASFFTSSPTTMKSFASILAICRDFLSSTPFGTRPNVDIVMSH